ncbi:prolyl oligopeptidase family serine peptidase [Gammaproteobacteria bacterium]|nr:prolyl oligopeptidase family serine peptidase [Gammaproteobacteria bacterium]MDA7701988.1 prolyl oligopeptidase family serine peptidase [Gammaproteobacteria bacterium]MDA8916285.1 prolyl oligopeptidase family serine peptidase [Gammaproteobacteria bacterium]MDA8926797.1 prolyl oligopeptidase family serine peptidase [Gammaproteobacteria bacterium]MDA8997792.1 prolyl oligopeptidase family serine peptidase [Gammaproteobacteria bacterium]|tara:strand:- start:13187 stop:15232 length:2046 start_codon:yes stop_codon:yes gene_type:complete
MMQAPKPKKIPYILEQHNHSRTDNYYWLRDDSRTNKEMLSYLESENEYADQWFSSRKPYSDEIAAELIQQIPDEETSFGFTNNRIKYFNKIKKNDQLPRYFRMVNGKEELLIDANENLKNQEYYSIQSISPSPSNKYVAFSEDNTGRREFTIKVLDTETMEVLADCIELTSGAPIWSKDNNYLIYSKKDPITLISDSVFVHKIGTNSTEDKLLFKEEDLKFNIFLSLSKSKDYIYINIDSTDENEIRLIDTMEPLESPLVFMARTNNHLYYLDHVEDDKFFVLSNHKAPNFHVLLSDMKTKNIKDMNVIVPHNDLIFINNIYTISNHLILEVRKNGLPEITILDLLTDSQSDIKFEDHAYDVALSSNNEKQNLKFNYTYSSLTSPESIYSYDLKENKSNLLWQKDIVGFDATNYIDKRLFVEVRDGTNVPVIFLSRLDTNLKEAPILFYGYGSYGINIDATFRSSLLPLIDRGFVFAIINIRGGGEMGKHWYEEGRLLNKLNTFNDFNDVVKSVLNQNIGNSKKVFARGGSAGGLLMGAIINFEPTLYRGILSGVPFVDVLTTMSDPTIPLTTFEYGEWGNPANLDEYNYIKQYSPYDNINDYNYPSVFVTSSLYDSQVQYFEPAKYIAKLRDHNQSANNIIMKMNLIGGHGGLSGRLNQFNEISMEYSFILNLADEDTKY